MTFEEFARSARGAEPATDSLTPPLKALWLDARGDWDGAHAACQEAASREGDWIHAYLHRKEGDLANAGYWYGRAGRPVREGSLDEEWKEIARALLEKG